MESEAIIGIATAIMCAASAITVATGHAEASEKLYLVACEYLQIDPAKVYDLDVIKKRIVFVRTQWTESDGIKQVKKLIKTLKWFEKNYIRLATKGYLNHNFANKFEKLVNKGKLTIHEGSVNETYVKCELCQKNYEYYSKSPKKRAILVICVLAAVISAFSAIVILIQK